MSSIIVYKNGKHSIPIREMKNLELQIWLWEPTSQLCRSIQLLWQSLPQQSLWKWEQEYLKITMAEDIRKNSICILKRKSLNMIFTHSDSTRNHGRNISRNSVFVGCNVNSFQHFLNSRSINSLQKNIGKGVLTKR